MRKWMPWIVAGIMAAWVVSTLRPQPDKSGYDIADFGRLPVLLNGRIQPMDSVARNSLLQLRGKQTVPVEGGGRLPAIAWLSEVFAKPEASDERKVFRIDHPDLLGMLSLPESEKFFSFGQLKPNLPELDRQARRIDESKKEAAEQTPFEKAVLQLHRNAMLYHRLKSSLRPEGSEDFASELEDYRRTIQPGVAAVRNQQAGREYNQEDFDRILEMLSRYDFVSRAAYPLVVPPENPEAGSRNWVNVGASLMDSIHAEGLNPAVVHYANMVSAYRKGDAARFNTALAEYRQWLGGRFDPELRKARQEFFFNRFQPFYKSMVVYVCALIAGLAFWLNWAEWVRRSAVWLTVLAFLIHTAGLVFRMYLEGRPPVTNLYSSAIFVGWGSVGLAMILERFYRDGIGVVAASIIGFATLIIAHHLSLSGDTMEMLRAVLDTNFWLATHVVVITLGYAAMFVAGLLAIIYIVRGVFTRSLGEAAGKALARMVYGIVCFATLFSFVGTILGGIWADQSWGRFWGWDPKENGALLIVIWCAIILHARWGKIIRERGLMCMAVFGNIVTSFSWFGVNMLGVGLHSYGFMDAAFKWLSLFVASQLLFIGIGLVPQRLWLSFRSGGAGAGRSRFASAGS